MKPVPLIAALVLVAVFPSTGVVADEPRADASLRLGVSDYGRLAATDVSFGVGLSYRLTSWLATDAVLALAPSNLGDPAFSGSRTEGALGFRLGPHLARTGVYAAVRPGFVKFAEPGEPTVCILIFPPPLRCTLATGKSVFALDLAGGLQLSNHRGLLRFEVGDRLVKYPGPILDADFEPREGGFWSHNLAASVAAGVCF
jgi:hypothetical protein